MNKAELFINELKNRDLIQNITNEKKVINALNNDKALYVGFDPSAISLHLGNYVIINILNLCEKYQIKYVCIVGGITGQIGDPSGKKSERVLLNKDTVKANVNGITKQLSTLLKNPLIINNETFYEHKSIIDFLRDVGKYINISYLLNKEIIKNRLETGISFTEFSYSLIQANDFYMLYKNHNVCVEVGGSDQWGNITIGIDYINKKDNLAEATSAVAGFTLKLLLKSDGTKFGKSEKGAVYLNNKLTSAYSMYQFLINQSDDDCNRLLNYLTNYSIDEIKSIIEESNLNKSQRIAQNKLAQNLVSRIHGNETYLKIKALSSMIFKNDVKNFTLEDIDLIKNDFAINKVDFNLNDNLVEILMKANIFKSKGELRKLIEQNGLSINGDKVKDFDKKISSDDLVLNKYLFIKKGKQEISIIEKK
ncbi:MAG: tyrosine--tRNA ligase [Mycoplasmataceae bacterium]|nr:tyrosine--tRNA ligase [Mycoplasmataceae bacterium]